MAFTYQTIVDLGRIPLNDKDKVRYTDDQLLAFANHGMLQIAKNRPDLFIGQFNSLPDGEAALSDPFPIDAAFAQVVANYVTARAEMMDDEHADSGRAVLFGNMFNSEAPV